MAETVFEKVLGFFILLGLIVAIAALLLFMLRALDEGSNQEIIRYYHCPTVSEEGE